MITKAWYGFNSGKWNNEIDVRDFIQVNYTPYTGESDFLQPCSEDSNTLWEMAQKLMKAESAKGGVLDADTSVIGTITSHGPGYLDKNIEKIVGFQTDKPLKRALQPVGGVKMSEQALEAYGYKMDPKVKEIFTKYRKTHNQGVFEAYTKEMREARHCAIITGLPDAYGRGRIIGDYRRIALYGLDRLIEDKYAQKELIDGSMSEFKIRLREELQMQINALKDIGIMGDAYGKNLRLPATNAQEAIQAVYFGYLSAVKDQNGAAMSIGRVSTFLDIYIQKDIANNVISEKEAQELMDQFIIKLRMVRFMRTPDYNDLFSGDPNWVTESIGGMGIDGRTLVTKNSFRILQTLYNLGPAPEPNLTVLWSTRLPQGFKNFAAKVSIDTSSIQYENDDLMRVDMGDDYGIACCVSAMKIGKDMQFFGARANLAKALLYAINGGMDEKKKEQVSPRFEPITSEYLDYDEVIRKYDQMLEWLAGLYVNTLNVIHYMHDKYSYEAAEMALHDTHVRRFFATGVAGLSVVADSLSAIKYAKVKVIRDEDGIAQDYEVEGDFPKYGNNDDQVDQLAVDLVKNFMQKISKHKTYRDGVHSLSILTITSNVVYGKKTGSTPDGRKSGAAFAPGANPMHGRDSNGALASLESVAKIPYEFAHDGISNTFSIVPDALGKEED